MKNHYFINTEDGSILIDGVGYCYPDSEVKTPAAGTYVTITEVKNMRASGKRYGFYKWEPAEFVLPTEEEVIETYLEKPWAKALFCPVEKLDMKNGTAICVRAFEYSPAYKKWELKGLPLDTWPAKEITVRADTKEAAREFLPGKPLFSGAKSMFDLLVEHGYAEVSDEEIFSAIRDAMRRNPLLMKTLPHGSIQERPLPDGGTLKIIVAEQYRSPVLRGVPLMEYFDGGYYEDVRSWRFYRRISEFFVARTAVELEVPTTAFHMERFPVQARPFEEVEPDAVEDLPDCVRKAAEKGFVKVDYLTGDFWWVALPEMPDRLCKFLAETSLDDLTGILDFAWTETPRARDEYRARERALDAVIPHGFERACPVEDDDLDLSEILQQMLEAECVELVCDTDEDGELVGETAVEISNRGELLASFTTEEIENAADEINAINKAAQKEVFSA